MIPAHGVFKPAPALGAQRSPLSGWRGAGSLVHYHELGCPIRRALDEWEPRPPAEPFLPLMLLLLVWSGHSCPLLLTLLLPFDLDGKPGKPGGKPGTGGNRGETG